MATGGPSSEDAERVRRAESEALLAFPLRRFRRFAELTGYVEDLTTSEWWDEAFPTAPVQVEVLRRSHRAGHSLAAPLDRGAGAIWLVDGHGWGLETVLHELAHLAAGPGAGHGRRFADALVALWRHEIGPAEATKLADELAEGTLRYT